MHKLGENISKENRHILKLSLYFYHNIDINEENHMKSKFGIYFLKWVVDLKVKIDNCSWFSYKFGKYSLNRIKLFCMTTLYVYMM